MTKITIGVVAAFLLAGSSASYAQSGYIPGKPSFDCTNASNTVAMILCSGPEAAAADWDVNSASWAFYFSVNESQRESVDAEQQAWRQSLDPICRLPRQQTSEDRAGRVMADIFGRMVFGPGVSIPGPQPITRQHVNCLINAYRARAAVLRSKLSGDALAESQLSPEQHVKLQDALAEKGFLRPDQIDSGNPDGKFGPITRTAIKQFQQSRAAYPSGFLSSNQRFALLERPEEREARIAREAAEEKARQDALRKAERDAQIESERQAAEQKAKRDAEQKRLQEEEQVKRDAELRRREAVLRDAEQVDQRRRDAELADRDAELRRRELELAKRDTELARREAERAKRDAEQWRTEGKAKPEQGTLAEGGNWTFPDNYTRKE